MGGVAAGTPARAPTARPLAPQAEVRPTHLYERTLFTTSQAASLASGEGGAPTQKVVSLWLSFVFLYTLPTAHSTLYFSLARGPRSSAEREV